MPQIYVHMLPTLLEGASLQSSTAIVIDILRASTTAVHALAHGATAIIPCLTVEDAIRQSEKLAPGQRLLGGERHGQLIPGFDLGNSPLDYTPDRVSGKELYFTTTNGTKALLHCRAAEHICMGAFSNRSAIANRCQSLNRDVHLVCAGTDGFLTGEDILFAGAIASDLVNSPARDWTSGSVQTQMAVDYFQARHQTPEKFREAFYQSLGARNLVELGMQRDIDRAMEMDLFDVVPEWNPETSIMTATS